VTVESVLGALLLMRKDGDNRLLSILYTSTATMNLCMNIPVSAS
jgi:hypothetical protein